MTVRFRVKQALVYWTYDSLTQRGEAMDRFSDDRDNLKPSDSGFDSDEAVSRNLARKARRKSSEAQAEDNSDVDRHPQDAGEERSERESEKPPEHHPHQLLHSPFLTHRPTFGRKGL